MEFYIRAIVIFYFKKYKIRSASKQTLNNLI